MEEFFEKLFTIDEYEDDQNDQIELFKSTFNSSELFIGKNINDLCFLSIEDNEEGALFKLANSNTIYRYYMFDPCWYQMCERYTLAIENQQELKLDGVELLDNSSRSVQYVLYPFDQENELPIKYLSIDGKNYLDTTLLKQIYCSDDEDNENSNDLHYEIKWTDKLTLVMGVDEPYKILYDGSFLSGFSDDVSHFQLGDCCTIVYTYDNNTLVICNHGDVSSVVIVIFNQL